MNVLKLIIMVNLTVVLVFVSTNGFSQKQLKKGKLSGASFDAIDADNDGKISRDEYLKIHEERFKKFDANGDGYLTEEEVKKTTAKDSKKAKKNTASKAKMRFGSLDTDDDGKISSEEWDSANPDRPEAGQMFDQIDTDKDGYLTKEELKSFKKREKEKKKKGPQKQE